MYCFWRSRWYLLSLTARARLLANCKGNVVKSLNRLRNATLWMLFRDFFVSSRALKPRYTLIPRSWKHDHYRISNFEFVLPMKILNKYPLLSGCSNGPNSRIHVLKCGLYRPTVYTTVVEGFMSDFLIKVLTLNYLINRADQNKQVWREDF